MDTPTILGAALAFSVAALPLVFYLYASGVKKDMTILEAKIIKEIEDKIDDKIDKILSELNHKKVSMEKLDTISSRLVRIAEKIDPKNKMGIYDE